MSMLVFLRILYANNNAQLLQAFVTSKERMRISESTDVISQLLHLDLKQKPDAVPNAKVEAQDQVFFP